MNEEQRISKRIESLKEEHEKIKKQVKWIALFFAIICVAQYFLLKRLNPYDPPESLELN